MAGKEEPRWRKSRGRRTKVDPSRRRDYASNREGAGTLIDRIDAIAETLEQSQSEIVSEAIRGFLDAQ